MQFGFDCRNVTFSLWEECGGEVVDVFWSEHHDVAE
jgi:hypothetical protein